VSILLGMPIGSTIGIMIIDKLYSKIIFPNIYSIIFAISFSTIGGFIGIFLCDKLNLKEWFLIIVPLLNVTMGIGGYNLGLLFNRPK
jgi:hypothetical protein